MTNVICAGCGTKNKTKRVTRGSFVVEMGMWLLFLLPGIIYSLWRLSSKHLVCEVCGCSELIPLDSPRGRALADQYHPPVSPQPAKKRRDEMTLEELIEAGID